MPNSFQAEVIRAIGGVDNTIVALLLFIGILISAYIKWKSQKELVQRVFENINIISKIVPSVILIGGLQYASIFTVGTLNSMVVAGVIGLISQRLILYQINDQIVELPGEN